MKKIRLVIDIDYEDYEAIKNMSVVGDMTIPYVFNAIRNGTPLPKGHGDLIYRDDLLADSYCIDDWSGNEVNIVDVKTVKMADAIIEAGKEVEKNEG